LGALECREERGRARLGYQLLVSFALRGQMITMRRATEG